MSPDILGRFGGGKGMKEHGNGNRKVHGNGWMDGKRGVVNFLLVREKACI